MQRKNKATEAVDNSEAQAMQMLLGEDSQHSLTGVDHARIAVLARDIWESEGCPLGQDVEHWLQAEKRLIQEGLQVVASIG